MKVLLDAEVADPQAALALLSGELDVTVLVVEQASLTPPAPLGQVATAVTDEAADQVARNVLHDAARRTVRTLEQRARQLLPSATDVRVTCGAAATELVRAIEHDEFDVAVVTPQNADVARLLRRHGSPCAVLVVPERRISNG
jgi:hypothetical protein